MNILSSIKNDRRWIWIILGISTILLRIALGYTPEIIESYYSRGLFIGIRAVFDHTIGLLPIPFLYVLLLGAFCFISYRIFRKKVKGLSFTHRLLNFLFSLLAVLSALVFFFLVLWGFNYARIPVEQQMGINPTPLSKKELTQEFLESTTALQNAYHQIKDKDETYFKSYIFDQSFEQKIRAEVSRTFQELDYPIYPNVRARLLYPKGSLLRISTAGFYLPFTGECHIDPGLHPLQIPAVMAHEFAHGYGIGDEGSCNFFAYLACSASNDPIIKYAGLLSYWRSVASQYRSIAPEEYKLARAKLPQGIINHLRQIRTEMDKYPDLFPAVRDATYNAYLKTQGVEEGLRSYSRVVLLVQAYRTTMD